MTRQGDRLGQRASAAVLELREEMELELIVEKYFKDNKAVKNGRQGCTRSEQSKVAEGEQLHFEQIGGVFVMAFLCLVGALVLYALSSAFNVCRSTRCARQLSTRARSACAGECGGGVVTAQWAER
jgi:hypothetical protein